MTVRDEGARAMIEPPDGPVTATVYMLASRRHGTLYVGVTARLVARLVQHREGLFDGFAKTYGVKRLVWFERHESIIPAIQREKSLKKYKREWKINLIERDNPHWDDLFPGLLREEGPLSHLSWREPPAPERRRRPSLGRDGGIGVHGSPGQAQG